MTYGSNHSLTVEETSPEEVFLENTGYNVQYAWYANCNKDELVLLILEIFHS